MAHRDDSPEHGCWNFVKGEFSHASQESFDNALERAPHGIHRLARAIARDDGYYHVRLGRMEEMSNVRALEFRGPDNEVHGWIVLNAKKEPVIWATAQNTYSFGPLKRFGNLQIPDRAMTSGGLVRYLMVSLKGSNRQPDISLFARLDEYRE